MSKRPPVRLDCPPPAASHAWASWRSQVRVSRSVRRVLIAAATAGHDRKTSSCTARATSTGRPPACRVSGVPGAATIRRSRVTNRKRSRSSKMSRTSAGTSSRTTSAPVTVPSSSTSTRRRKASITLGSPRLRRARMSFVASVARRSITRPTGPISSYRFAVITAGVQPRVALRELLEQRREERQGVALCCVLDDPIDERLRLEPNPGDVRRPHDDLPQRLAAEWANPDRVDLPEPCQRGVLEPCVEGHAPDGGDHHETVRIDCLEACHQSLTCARSARVIRSSA